jgi:NitT/TauT family transport system permease protein
MTTQPIASAASAREGGSHYALSELAPTLILSAAVLLVWELVIRLLRVPNFVLPAPSAIVSSLIENRAQLLNATKSTAVEILFGFALAAIVGIGVALVIVRFERFGKALYPLVVLFQTVPKVALAPIFILWFGYDLAPKI